MKTKQNAGQLSRRQFLSTSAALASFSIVPRHVVAGSGQPAPSDKMNVGCVGVGGMGASDARNVSGENMYAICDVDENNLNTAAALYPKAKKYRDFREMLDKEHKNLNGITVSIPDHMHASVALWAMERGVGVYCQKPLTQSVWEARLLTKAAAKFKVATQMGNQGFSSEGTRIACEIVWNGTIGDVTAVHAMSGSGYAREIMAWPPNEPVPATLDWDLWTGRAPEHTYSSKIVPLNWRGFQNYGSQMIGDWAVHMLGPALWALQLDSPTSVECTAVAGVNPVTYPHYACKFEFPERPNRYVKAGTMPPVTVYWYEGNMAKSFNALSGFTPEERKPFNAFMVGTKGCLGTAGHGNSARLLPESAMKDFQKPPQVLKRVLGGHHKNWINACKGGEPACSNFSVGGPYTEWLLLGAISWRFPNEKLIWDSKNLRFTNNEKANEFIKPYFRKGWELQDITV